MALQNPSEAKLAWMIWQALEKLNALLWDRYASDFLALAMEENDHPQKSTTSGIEPIDDSFPDDSISPNI